VDRLYHMVSLRSVDHELNLRLANYGTNHAQQIQQGRLSCAVESNVANPASFYHRVSSSN